MAKDSDFDGAPESFLDKMQNFFDENLWAYFVIFLVCFGLFSYALYNSSPNPSVVRYDFNYGPAIVYKTVSNDNGKHTEQISVSSKSGAKLLTLFVLVPKQLAQNKDELSLVSNGKISVLKNDPLFKVEAISTDSIATELSVETNASNVCSLLIVMHSATVAELTPEQLQDTINSIVEKDSSSLTCDKANQIEKDLAQRIYAATTE